MPSKRFHTKTREGCKQCKQSRIKCDEQKPQCGKCIRKGAACSFSGTDSSLVVIPSSYSSTPQSESTSGPAPESIPDQLVAKNEVELDDSERGNLKLMHHYILRGYIDVVGPDPTSEDLPSLWRDYAPKLAFDHKYLLHGLLGISALHLGISDPESQYGDALLASHHYNLAIAEFRTQLTTITTDNIEPLFAFSCILILYCFGTWHIARDRSDPITKLIEILSLIQGTGSIVMSGFDRLKASPFNALLLSSPGVPLPDLPLEIQDVLSKLQSRVSSISDLDLYRDAYSSSLFALQRSFILAMQNPGSNLITVSFAVRITPEFLILATKREPLALAVLANYAALLHTVREHLWFQNWGRQVIHTVEQSLPLEWRDCIDWAVFQAKEG